MLNTEKSCDTHRRPPESHVPPSAHDALQRVVFAATAADVTDVVVAGRRVVAGGEHQLLGDVGTLLDRAVAAVL